MANDQVREDALRRCTDEGRARRLEHIVRLVAS